MTGTPLLPPDIRVVCQINGTRYKHVPAIFSGTLTAIRILSLSIPASHSRVSVVIDSIQRVMSCIEAFVIIQGIMTWCNYNTRDVDIATEIFVIATHIIVNKTKYALTDCGKIIDCNILIFYYVWEIVICILILQTMHVYVYLGKFACFIYYVIQFSCYKSERCV